MDCIVHGVSKSRTWLSDFWASLVAPLVNTMPAVQEIQIRFLGQEDPLEKGIREEPGGLQFIGSERVGQD